MFPVQNIMEYIPKSRPELMIYKVQTCKVNDKRERYRGEEVKEHLVDTLDYLNFYYKEWQGHGDSRDSENNKISSKILEVEPLTKVSLHEIDYY